MVALRLGHTWEPADQIVNSGNIHDTTSQDIHRPELADIGAVLEHVIRPGRLDDPLLLALVDLEAESMLEIQLQSGVLQRGTDVLQDLGADVGASLGSWWGVTESATIEQTSATIASRKSARNTCN